MPQPMRSPGPRNSDTGGTGAQIAELKDLVVGYAKQETVDPLKTLGRYLGFGFAGSLLIGSGLCLLLLALLRGLQEITFFNDHAIDKVAGGTFSWVPYMITAVVGVVIVAIFVSRLISAINEREDR